MTLAELKTLLTGTGLPVSFSSVPLDQNSARPYICFFQDADRTFAADGIVYYSRKVNERHAGYCLFSIIECGTQFLD